MAEPEPNRNAAIAALCPNCGLCCNGVIFSDVKLRPRDLKAVAAFGLSASKNRLPQPCPAFDGKLCRIYEERPAPCRGFDCRLVQQTGTGTLTPTEALRRIRGAKALVHVVENLLRKLGQNDASVPLSHKFSNVMAEPLDLSADARTLRLRGQLSRAVDKLGKRLARDFVG